MPSGCSRADLFRGSEDAGWSSKGFPLYQYKPIYIHNPIYQTEYCRAYAGTQPQHTPFHRPAGFSFSTNVFITIESTKKNLNPKP